MPVVSAQTAAGVAGAPGEPGLIFSACRPVLEFLTLGRGQATIADRLAVAPRAAERMVRSPLIEGLKPAADFDPVPAEFRSRARAPSALPTVNVRAARRFAANSQRVHLVDRRTSDIMERAIRPKNCYGRRNLRLQLGHTIVEAARAGGFALVWRNESIGLGVARFLPVC